MMKNTFRRAGSALLLIAAAACSDDGPAGPAAVGPSENVSAAVVLDWTVDRYTTAPPSDEWAEAFALPTGELYIAGFAPKLAVEKNGAYTSIPINKQWDLNDVWASSPTNVIVVGTTGLYGRAGMWNGTSFVDMMVPAKIAPLQAVWGFAANNVYAVGGGNILRWNGTSWTIVFTAPVSFFGIWGSGPSDIFAVGSGGAIYHYDGNGWTQQSSGTTQKLDAIWGFSSSDVHVVGDNGVALRYNGTSWSPTGTLPADMKGLWGAAPDDLWAVGMEGWISHYDGDGWTSIQEPVQGGLYGIAGHSATDIHAVGNAYLVYDGEEWSPPSAAYTVTGMWGFKNSLAFATTNQGAILRWDGVEWTRMPSPPSGALHDIWGSSPSDLYAVGLNGKILHFNGTSWSQMVSGTTRTLYGVWGYRGVVFAVGAEGTALRYNGTTWQPTPTGTTATLSDVHGTSDTRVFAAAGPKVLVFDGASWSGASPPACSCDLQSVWATPTALFAAGSGGALYVRRTSVWERTTVAGSPTMQALWGSGPNDVFAVGAASTIRHWDGVSWTTVAPPAGVSSTFTSVWLRGSDPNTIFVGGTNSLLARGHR